MFSATSFVVPCMSTLAAKHGSHDQKGKVMGILRSLGALARALGPVFASTGNDDYPKIFELFLIIVVFCIAYWILGSSFTYISGAVLLTVPWYLLRKAN
jgi:hypothetical protein